MAAPISSYALGLLGGGAVGLGQGIVGVTQNDAIQRFNRDKLEELMALQAGGGLGLTSTEQRLATQQATDPVRREATAARGRQEQLLAAAGNSVSGADQSRLRTEQTRLVGDAVAAAAQQVQAANEAKKQQQLQEIEARTAAKSAFKQDDISGFFGGASELASAVGQAAGAPPGTSQLGPLFGARFGALNFSDPELEAIRQLQQSDPAALQRLIDELGG